MTFYYTEPKAGNLWVFALDGGPRAVQPGTNLTPLPGGLPRVGEPGHTLGGRVLPGYGFEPTAGSEPIAPGAPAAADPPSTPDASDAGNLLLDDAAAIVAGERIYRERCVICHRSGGGAGPSLFRNRLPLGEFLDTVNRGRPGTNMPAFEELLTPDEIWQVHAFLMSRDAL